MFLAIFFTVSRSFFIRFSLSDASRLDKDKTRRETLSSELRLEKMLEFEEALGFGLRVSEAKNALIKNLVWI